MTDFTPRPHQQAILAYTGGKMGIAAVPGAGKTHVLSALAARLIAEGRLDTDQEVLVVTLVNSAVDNFSNRISGFIRETGLLPHLGYRVRTLHGLAHDIVREKPAAVGLETRFSIIDEREAAFIRKEAVNAWLNANPYALDDYLDPNLDDSKRDWVRRQQLPDMLDSLALAFIRSAKDRRLTPDSLRLLLDRLPVSSPKGAPLPLAEMGLTIYSDYQRALTYRGAVDFDDLIRLALDLLEADEEYLERLRYRFPYILEDEAQDSSLLQEQILRLLAGEAGNWVRVGDPNQAIFETFTTASPKYLRAFIAHEADFRQELPVSGRSQPSVIKIANYLINWVMNEHPAEAVRDALAPPEIRPTELDDPQPNPPDDPAGIHFVRNRFTPEEELKAVIDSLARWLPGNADKTVAVLVPRNVRGVDVINALKARGLDYVEFLSSTSTTRAAAGSIANLLGYLSDPGSAGKLSKAYQVWRRDWRDEESLREIAAGRVGLSSEQSEYNETRIAQSPQGETSEEDVVSIQRESAACSTTEEIEALLAMTRRSAELLRKVRKVEDFISPLTPDSPLPRGAPFGDDKGLGVRDSWLATLHESPAGMISEADEVIQELIDFRVHVKRWLEAVALPIDQLVLTLAQDVFTSPADLALAHKLALVLRSAADDHADWRLPELTSELAVIAKNERRFIGFSSDDAGFDPERHRGKVVVTTLHKAKGLEWERVYLMSVNNYDFPALQAYDRFISEKWFVRASTGSAGPLNLEAEALAQLMAALSTGEYDWYAEGRATLAARADYVRERLRLFYVGLTRAKRELVVTWNTGRTGEQTQAIPFTALAGWWESSR